MLTIPILGDGLPVMITELDIPFRFLLFAGRDRPEPVTRTTTQRAVQTWYPGASQASTQVMGSKEEPITLRGWFRDPLTMLDGGPQARVAVARGLCQGRNRCNLMWGDTIVAYGRVTKAEFTFITVTRVQYEIEFTIDAAAETTALVPLPLVAAVASDLAGAITAAAAALDVAAETARTIGAVDAFNAPMGG